MLAPLRGGPCLCRVVAGSTPGPTPIAKSSDWPIRENFAAETWDTPIGNALFQVSAAFSTCDFLPVFRFSLHQETLRNSSPELPQVMIQMFVHSAAPILRRERAEERMRMPCAFLFPALVKLAHAELEPFLLALKIPLIGND